MNLREEGIRLLGLDLSEWKREEVRREVDGEEMFNGKRVSGGKEGVN